MKRILLLLLIACPGLCYAQNIKIDFAKKTIEIPSRDKLQNQREVQIIVENIPTSAYKVSINKTDSFITTGTPPPLFGVLSFGDGFNSLLAGLSSHSIRNAGVIVSSKDKKAGGVEGYKIYGLDGGNNDATAALINDFLSQVACDTIVRDIMPVIKSMRKKVFEFHYKFRDNIIKKTDQLIYEVNLGIIQAANFKSGAEAIIRDRLSYEKELESEYNTYYDIILPVYNSVSKCIPLATADSMLTSYKQSFFQFLNKYDTTFNEVLIVKVYKQLNAPAPVTGFTSLPYRLKSDVTKFSIDISGVDPSKTPQSYNTVVELERHPNKIWSFTSGVFVSNLTNHDFSILTNVQPNAQNPLKNDTLNYSIIKEENNKISAGINALMHLGGYFGEQNEIGAYLAFGPGLTLEKTPQVRVFVGAGLMFGRTNKLALSFGWNGGFVKRLSSNYNLNQRYNPTPNDIVRDQFKGGGFISLGYSIFGK